MIAKPIFGLLDKCKNSNQRSFYFHDLNEAVSLQAKVGGKLNMMSKNSAKSVNECDKNGIWCPGGEVCAKHDSLYYTLNVVDRCELTVGS